jgi:hypothetical protein
MIKNYGDFKTNLEKMIMIRAANYVEVDCDIHVLIETVYNDIQNEVLMQYESYPIMITSSDMSFELPPLSLGGSRQYTDVLDIVDINEYSILEYFHEVSNNVWQFNNKPCTTDVVMNDGDTVFFVRKVIIDIEELPLEWYQKITTTMLEGVMYYIQTAIPNQVDGQVGNFSYKRYYNAKKALIDSSSQHMTYTTRENKWI